MTIQEIKDPGDARARLSELYGIQGDDAQPYVDLLGVLCGWDTHPSFSKNLEIVSSMIWHEYNRSGMAARPNRFTRSIINLANKKFGFLMQDNVVFAGPLDGRSFGERVRGKILWKDSFALGHGEFSHSYQWLAAGFALGWNEATADVYANTAGRMSVSPIFVKDNDGIAYRRSPMWEWLVDCTRHQNWFDAPVRHATAVKAWAEKRPSSEPKRTAEELEAMAAAYPQRNALTKTSFRSANNVATLAREQSEWFISYYEVHRQAKLKEAQARGVELVEQFDVSAMKSSAALIPLGNKPYLGANGIARGDEHDPAYLEKVGKDAQRAASHPIQGIKAERALHYGLEKPSQGEAWNSPAKFVHHKPIDLTVRAAVPKDQVEISLHGVKGTINKKVKGLVV